MPVSPLATVQVEPMSHRAVVDRGADRLTYDSEEVISYEIGLKNSLIE